MALLVYGEVSAISYVGSPGIAVFLSPEQQSLLVQAINLFNSHDLWADYEENSDEIDALVSSSELALLESVDVPTVSIADYLLLLHRHNTVVAGNALTWQVNTSQIFNGFAFQSAGALNDEWRSPAFRLRAGTWQLNILTFRQNNIGQLTYALTDGVTDYAGSMVDLYNASSQFNFLITEGFVLASDVQAYLRGRVLGKNASSSAYNVGISYISIQRTGD